MVVLYTALAVIGGCGPGGPYVVLPGFHAMPGTLMGTWSPIHGELNERVDDDVLFVAREQASKQRDHIAQHPLGDPPQQREQPL